MIIHELVPILVDERKVHLGHVAQGDDGHASAYPVCVAGCAIGPGSGAGCYDLGITWGFVSESDPERLCPAFDRTSYARPHQTRPPGEQGIGGRAGDAPRDDPGGRLPSPGSVA